MPTKQKYAKIGEMVKIVVPKLFIRCGYELTVEVVKERFSDEIDKLRDQIIELMVPMPKVTQPLTLESYLPGVERNGRPTIDPTTDNQIEKAIAYMIIRREGFGGKERKVYEKEYESLKNGPIVKVIGKHVCYSGTYQRGRTHYSYDGEIDSWGPSLEHAKAHMVYDIEFVDSIICNSLWKLPIPLKVLAANCEPVA